MISLVAQALLGVLRDSIPPLLEPSQIGICSPAEKDETFLLGLFLFNIAKDTRYQYQLAGNLRIDSNVRQLPPVCVEVGVMVTSYVGRKSGLLDDYRLLEHVLQILPDTKELPYTSALQPNFVPVPRIELQSLDADAVSKIWQFPGVPYRLSLFYKCSPIAVPSLKQIVTPRVGSVDYNMKDDRDGQD